MMKFILLSGALIALIRPSIQLTCYMCRGDDFKSSLDFVNSYNICASNLASSNQIKDLPSTDFLKCKKLVEKVVDNNVATYHVIRTYGIYDMGLNSSVFQEYTCDTNLCNGSDAASATVFSILLLSLASITLIHL